MAIDHQISEFVDMLRTTEGRAENTVKSYRSDLEAFARFAARTGAATLDAARDQVPIHIAELAASGASADTRRRHVAAIRRLYAWSDASGLTSGKPVPSVRIRRPVRVPRGVALEVIERMLGALPNDDGGARDRAVIELLYSAGLRVAELCGIDLSRLSFDPQQVSVMGKGSRERIVPFGTKAAEALRAYLGGPRERLVDAGPGTDALFVNKYGAPLSTQAVRQLFKRLQHRLGLDRIHPHALRHSCASHTYSNGADIATIQVLLGHSDISTTLIYTHVDRSRVREAQRRFHPRG